MQHDRYAVAFYLRSTGIPCMCRSRRDPRRWREGGLRVFRAANSIRSRRGGERPRLNRASPSTPSSPPS